jgi:hypothetical protein
MRHDGDSDLPHQPRVLSDWVVRELGLYAPEAEVEDEELAEVDLLELDGLTFGNCLPRVSGLIRRPHRTAKIRASRS